MSIARSIYSENAGILLQVVVVALLLVIVLLLTDGNPAAGTAFVALVVVIWLTLYRVDWGFYIFLICVFLFDQFDIPGFPTFTSSIQYFNNMSSINYLPSMSGAAVTPMELHLFFIFLVWVAVQAINKNIHLAKVPMKPLAAIFYLSLFGSLIYGQISGGDIIIALWETRALVYLGFLFLFVPQIIRTKEQLKITLWICILGIGVKAAQGAARYASLGFSFGWWPNIYETLTNHEDPVFFVTLFLLLAGFVLFKARTPQRAFLTWFLPVLLIGFVAGQRRATYASCMASFLAFGILLQGTERRRFLRSVGAFILVFGVYLGIYWNSNSRIGYVAQQFKSTVTDEPGIRGAKDVTSTLYRKLENYNLAYTFRISPIVGIGFGQPFERPLRLWNIDLNKLGRYIPHNQILWLFVKMGALGAFTFFLFFNGFAFRAAMVFTRLRDPYLKAICALCAVAAINQFVVSYVDMQLTWYRNMVYLGVLLSLIPTLEHLDSGHEPDEKKPRSLEPVS